MLWQQVLLIVLSYLLGSVLFSYHLPKWVSGVDITKASEDHNPGAYNAFRFAGVPAGLGCLALDMLKGFLPAWAALRLWGPDFPLLPLVMLSPVLGHAMAPWYAFGGGKAIATSFGVLAGLLPYSPAVWVLVFWHLFYSLVCVLHPNEKRSVATFLCFMGTCALAGLRSHELPLAMGCVLMALPPLWKNLLSPRKLRRREAEAMLKPRA